MKRWLLCLFIFHRPSRMVCKGAYRIRYGLALNIWEGGSYYCVECGKKIWYRVK